MFLGVYSFKYLGCVLHRTDEDWPAVRHNIVRARKFWGRLGKLLRREGADQIISASFYRAVVQAVLLFGAESWVLTETMLQKLEGVHVDFLRQVAGTSARKLGVDTWKKEGEERVLQATGENPLRGYIERRQAAVAEWVDLQLLFEVCAEETGFDGGGRAREQWWHQIAVKGVGHTPNT